MNQIFQGQEGLLAFPSLMMNFDELILYYNILIKVLKYNFNIVVKEYRLKEIGFTKILIGFLLAIVGLFFVIICYGAGENIFSFLSFTNKILWYTYLFFVIVISFAMYCYMLKSTLDNLHILYILDFEKNKLTIINIKKNAEDYHLDKISYFEEAKGGFGIVDNKKTIKFMPWVENFDELRKYIIKICPEFKR